ncbi:DUF6879 family protein [Streptosporangium soli]|nr:hypothetical protein [Streptosporangium sp. KLBMP 9127]
MRRIPGPLKTYGPGESKPSFAALLAGCTTSAVHLEMHDQHMTTDQGYLAWKAGLPQPDTESMKAFRAMIRGAVIRGVRVRRARIVSEPASDYVRWEHSLTSGHNIAAGELVRWLPRPVASTLAIPGNPFWIFDGRLVRFTLFSGNGEVTGHQFTDDPAVIDGCLTAFETVWEIAIDHKEYRLHGN